MGVNHTSLQDYLLVLEQAKFHLDHTPIFSVERRLLGKAIHSILNVGITVTLGFLLLGLYYMLDVLFRSTNKEEIDQIPYPHNLLSHPVPVVTGKWWGMGLLDTTRRFLFLFLIHFLISSYSVNKVFDPSLNLIFKSERFAKGPHPSFQH